MRSVGTTSRLSVRRRILSKIWSILDDKVRRLYARLYVDRGCGQRYLHDVLFHMIEHDMRRSIRYDLFLS